MSFQRYNDSYKTYVPIFRTLAAEVPEKSLTEKVETHACKQKISHTEQNNVPLRHTLPVRSMNMCKDEQNRLHLYNVSYHVAQQLLSGI